MTSPSQTFGRMPPALSALFTEYLQGQAAAQAQGLGFAAPVGEVEPYESAPVQPVDPRQAWSDALAAADHFPGAKAAWTPPDDWPTVVAGQESAVAVAFCLGNFPQMVRRPPPGAYRRRSDASCAAIRRSATAVLDDRMVAELRRRTAGIVGVAGVLRVAGPVRRGSPTSLGRWQPCRGWRAAHANEKCSMQPGIAASASRPRRPGGIVRNARQSCSIACMSGLFLGDAASAHGTLIRATAFEPAGVRAMAFCCAARSSAFCPRRRSRMMIDAGLSRRRGGVLLWPVVAAHLLQLPLLPDLQCNQAAGAGRSILPFGAPYGAFPICDNFSSWQQRDAASVRALCPGGTSFSVQTDPYQCSRRNRAPP